MEGYYKEVNMDYILEFEKLDKNSLPIVGGKNASLGEMIKAAIRVPPGFAVTTDSYLLFITDAGIKARIIDRVSDLDPDDVAALNKASADVQELIKKTPMRSGALKRNRRGFAHRQLRRSAGHLSLDSGGGAGYPQSSELLGQFIYPPRNRLPH